MKTINIILGGAGFIGSNLAKCLKEDNEEVFIIDDFSLGKRENLIFLDHEYIFEVDASEKNSLINCFSEMQTKREIYDARVWHLAANSDIQQGVSDPNVDFNKTLLTTFNLLEVMRHFKLSKLCFASSSAVYGDKGDENISELQPQLEPISNYGACKLASEALISAARETHLKDVSIFRFPNVVGAPATHGVIFDFAIRLKNNRNRLTVLGDGTQKKSYLHVDDLITAMKIISDYRTKDRLKIFNIGPADTGITVSRIAELTVEHIAPGALIDFGRENRGWIGDVPKFSYDISKLQSIGWTPHNDSEHAVIKAICEIWEQLNDNH